MPDLQDGESVEMAGSASRPYVLKNVGGVYSCSLPGLAAPVAADRAQVRGYRTGTEFRSRQGHAFLPPAWFTAGLPPVPLDGELWLGRKLFQRTVGIVRRQDLTDLWKEVRFLVFDVPDAGEVFEARLAAATRMLHEFRPPYARVHEHVLCGGVDHLRRELARVERLGGEGLMLRQPESRYQAGRSATLLKVKSFHDAEARVVGHEAGRGRHKGRLGALLVEMSDGIRFAVGTGLSDAERLSPPPLDTWVAFRFQGLTDGGVPRFPVFVGRC
jgi:DNA ligase